jgi:hypothetical protein
LPALLAALLALASAYGVDGYAQSAVASSEEEAAARHDPIDPLLSAKLQWDALNEAKLLLDYSYACNASVRAAQRVRVQRRFERRLLRITERFRSEFGQSVIEHGHVIIGIGRCVQHSSGPMADGTAVFARQLNRIERWLAMTPAERQSP